MSFRRKSDHLESVKTLKVTLQGEWRIWNTWNAQIWENNLKFIKDSCEFNNLNFLGEKFQDIIYIIF